MVPSTSQHVETADSVASMVRNRDANPVASSRIGKRVLGEDRGNIDDKGKLSLRLMVQRGAASSTNFMGVPPPLLPCRGHAKLALGPVVGGIGGHMKLEPQAKFIGKGFPIIPDWLRKTAN